ncbi:TM2 domain-containing protein [Thorsellia anophelis]|uniref:TM2 domain-containing protein n=1 Tax=Thorsellia anophelis DSM 18579 TaxID=1123402 RepID=A0A1I0F9J4_9GAMM|nr:TM2 domain-containing protein [Thorsellia anophelis]SET54168.1 TM2 domain-containing protein [Thorsellia anophelis DSM 18579]
MKGQVLDYSVQSNEGIIISNEGQRYKFNGYEWKEMNAPQRGMSVDFDISEDGKATEIYLALGNKSLNNSFNSGSVSPKTKTAYILLALFLGGFGAHKFYMGSWGWGIIYIIASLIFFGGVIASIVEIIRALTLPEPLFNQKVEEFQKKNLGPFGFFW